MITIEDGSGNSTLYNVYQAGSSTILNNITSQVRPRTNVETNFYSADYGTLSAVIKDSSSAAATNGSIALTTADNSGTNGYLVISSEADYYSGTTEKENFWKILNCHILAPADLTDTTIEYSYQLNHSVSGATNTVTFRLDDSITPSFTTTPFFLDDGIVSNVTDNYVSGVKSLGYNQTINVDFKTAGTIKSYYNYTYGLGAATGTEIVDTFEKDLSTRNVVNYITDSTQNFVLQPTILNNVYTEQLSVSANIYNSKGDVVSQTINTKNSLNIRVDSKSSNSYQVISGVGQYPTSYGGTYLHTESLLINQELQLLDNKYQRPAEVDYSQNLPSGSPNYTTANSSLSDSDPYRYVTFKFTFTSKSEFYMLFADQEGTNWGSGNTIATLMRINIRIVDSSTASDSNWLDGNKFFSGAKIPNTNGDGILSSNSTTNAQKHFLLGTIRTGLLYVRIGLVCKGSSVSDKKFSGVSIHNTSQI